MVRLDSLYLFSHLERRVSFCVWYQICKWRRKRYIQKLIQMHSRQYKCYPGRGLSWMKHIMENLHQLWPLRKPTTFRYLPQIVHVPFKTRMIPFPDNCTTRSPTMWLFTVWPQKTWGDLESWGPKWPVCLAKGKVRCFYLYLSWQIGHDVYVDSKTINTAWNVQ